MYIYIEEVRSVNVLFLKSMVSWMFSVLFILSVYWKTLMKVFFGVNLWMLIKYSKRISYCTETRGRGTVGEKYNR